ncbi:DNA-directed DNA/RNA polymerase mu isoform X2 [Varanus komodoensis]|uniref:DNA-directed DNA/RNA polymerase mu isoform X2 n=1 Tax=Varanus komodoensis TaxID=61221 RepID=UPI001CF77DE7|nr:DNA-directed DNA/RNA polymerase mu isoform X2 [Varanus komodoensis]
MYFRKASPRWGSYVQRVRCALRRVDVARAAAALLSRSRILLGSLAKKGLPPAGPPALMEPLPVKRKRPRPRDPIPAPAPEQPVRFPEVVLCLVEKRMGASRRSFLASLARSKGFCVEEAHSARVTHVVSEGNSGDEVVEWLRKKGRGCLDAPGKEPALLDLSWFTEAMSAGWPVKVEPRHCLQVTARAEKQKDKAQVAPYACQRRSPLAHRNPMLTEALETVAEEAYFCGNEGRSLAFSRAATVLKSLTCTVRSVSELSALPGLGVHCKRILQEVLEDGTSAEVERIRQSDRYQTMKLFTKMFGVGVKTASQWYQEGLRTLQDLQMRCTKLSREQQAGLLHYTDLSTPVERPEAEAISQLVREVAERYLPGTSVTLTGGFRRGKRSGHDVDLLITHPVESREEGLLSKIISWLHSQGFLLYQNSCRNTFQPFKMEVQEASGSAGSMDRFEQCFSIFRLADRPGGPRGDAGAQKPGASSSRKAVRVDLVISPYSQFPFALLGWTGSRNFERDLRRFARQEKKMALNSHALYHMEQKIFLPAASEEEIFQHLGLEYIPPEERNA